MSTLKSTIHPKCPITTHKLANELPMLSGADAAAFRKTITEVGHIKNPIVIIKSGSPIGFGRIYDEDGKLGDAILAGRQRTYHALDVGIEWKDIPKRFYDEKKDGPVEQFIVREEVTGRRHLSDANKAIIGAKLYAILQELSNDAKKNAKKDTGSASKEPTSLEQTGDSAEGKSAKGKKAEKESHTLRKQAAAETGVSVDAVKKGINISKYKDLVDAVQNKKMSLDAANTEATRRKDEEKAKKNANKIKAERSDAIQVIKTDYGENHPFTKAVISKKVFGDEQKGHKQLLTFSELKLNQQIKIVPLLVERGLSLDAALEAESFKDADFVETDTIETLINTLITRGLGDGEKSMKIGGHTITVKLASETCKSIKELATAAR